MAYSSGVVYASDNVESVLRNIRVESVLEERTRRSMEDRIDGIKMLNLHEIPTDLSKSGSIIYFGDSRVVGMSMSGGDQVYVGKVAMGYNWMAGEGKNILLSKMSQYPKAQVVFCFGVNDVGNIGSYVSFFNDFISQYPERNIWFESVNPISDGMAAANGYFARNYMVKTFNSQLADGVADKYLDTYDILIQNGFGSPDGIHYDAGTYLNIENLTKDLILEKL